MLTIREKGERKRNVERRIVFHFSTMVFVKKNSFHEILEIKWIPFRKPRGVFHSVAVEEGNSALCRVCRHASCGKRFCDSFVLPGKEPRLFLSHARACVQGRRRPIRQTFRAAALAAVEFFLGARRSGRCLFMPGILALHVRQDGASMHIYSGRRLRKGEPGLCVRLPFMRCFPSYPC